MGRMDWWMAVGVVVVGWVSTCCGLYPRPEARPAPRPPPPDLAEEAAAWCRSADPSIRTLCSNLRDEMPSQGLYLGLSFRPAEAPTLDDGHLSLLRLETSSYSVGGILPPMDRHDEVDEIERRVRECLRRGCPEGLTLPPALYDLLQKPILRHAHVTVSEDRHLHGLISGHGTRSAYDLVSLPDLPGWLVAVDDYTLGLDKVNVYLRIPVQRGGR